MELSTIFQPSTPLPPTPTPTSPTPAPEKHKHKEEEEEEEEEETIRAINDALYYYNTSSFFYFFIFLLFPVESPISISHTSMFHERELVHFLFFFQSVLAYRPTWRT